MMHIFCIIFYFRLLKKCCTQSFSQITDKKWWTEKEFSVKYSRKKIFVIYTFYNLWLKKIENFIVIKTKNSNTFLSDILSKIFVEQYIVFNIYQSCYGCKLQVTRSLILLWYTSQTLTHSIQFIYYWFVARWVTVIRR